MCTALYEYSLCLEKERKEEGGGHADARVTPRAVWPCGNPCGAPPGRARNAARPAVRYYVPEVAAALLWSLPASGGSAMPYLYVAFLAVLLLDRVYRDDARCAAKYGKAWKQKKCFRFYRDSNIRGLCPLGSLALTRYGKDRAGGRFALMFR